MGQTPAHRLAESIQPFLCSSRPPGQWLLPPTGSGHAGHVPALQPEREPRARDGPRDPPESGVTVSPGLLCGGGGKVFTETLPDSPAALRAGPGGVPGLSPSAPARLGVPSVLVPFEEHDSRSCFLGSEMPPYLSRTSLESCS